VTVDALIKEAKKLSASELDALVEQLTEQLVDQADPGVTEAWNREIVLRWQRFERGEDEAMDWDTARAAMFGKRG
jgi:hypothetical protein